jgi:hypothetical protein
MMKNGSILLLVAWLGAGCVDPTAVVIEPLRVINWSPTSGAFCVDVNARISATFSDVLDTATLTADTFYLLSADGRVDATVSYDLAALTAELEPTESLRFDTLYTVVAAQGIRSQEQGGLSVDLDASFQTVARNGCTPGVECVLPSECPDNQICANIGICIDECVTDKDCFRGTCDLSSNTCVPESQEDGGGGDPEPGD